MKGLEILLSPYFWLEQNTDCGNIYRRKLIPNVKTSRALKFRHQLSQLPCRNAVHYSCNHNFFVLFCFVFGDYQNFCGVIAKPLDAHSFGYSMPGVFNFSFTCFFRTHCKSVNANFTSFMGDTLSLFVHV